MANKNGLLYFEDSHLFNKNLNRLKEGAMTFRQMTMPIVGTIPIDQTTFYEVCICPLLHFDNEKNIFNWHRIVCQFRIVKKLQF
jgi:hypothetical protein